MSNKIKFVAGMNVPVGSTAHTRGQGDYLVVDVATDKRVRRRDNCTIYGVGSNGWMPWKADGHDVDGPSRWSIEFVTLAEQPALFKIGDIVYCTLHGKGTVGAVASDGRLYNVRVRFDKFDEQVYTEEGAYRAGYKRTLFFAPLVPNATHLNRPRPVFSPGNVVFNTRSGAVSIVSHDDADTDRTTLFQSGGSSGPTFTVSHSQLRLIAESTSKE
jgi:hypothetical protein